jgi:hypothetical protein
MTDQPLTENERKLPPHLGGHFGNTNLDEATLCYLVSRYRIESMLDVGCGPGGMVELAWRLGLHAWGIDGDRFGPPWIIKHDYTTGPYVGMPADLIWCTEFVEHVEAQYQENYLATFATGQVLFLTAAPPGFPGHHHVNCQPESYWMQLLAQHGWRHDREATAWVRQNGGHIFSQRQGLVFVRS